MKKKEVITTAVFCTVLGVVTLSSVLCPDRATSTAERRKLQQFPDVKVSSVLDGSFMTGLEDYFLDQFPLRDEMRTVKSAFNTYLLGRKDNNSVYQYKGFLAKMEYPLQESAFAYNVSRLAQIQRNYFPDRKVYATLIPDKNYFMGKESGHLTMDYDRAVELMQGLDARYIDIFPTLELSDYYRTDTHWSQEKIADTARTIAEALGVEDRISWNYEVNAIPDFYGVYYGQMALPVKPDTISYVTNPVIENASVYNADTQRTGSVYDLDKLTDPKSMDRYDIFLSGAVSLLEITNEAQEEGHLVVFRDSFGSSLVPYLIEGYHTVTVVDIRYLSSFLLSNYVDFSDADILFAYSTLVLNSSGVFK